MKINKKAFTLVELLVVILIIGILAAIAVPNYMITTKTAKVKGYMTMAKALHDAQKVYLLAHNSYTNNIAELDIDVDYERKKDFQSGIYTYTRYYTSWGYFTLYPQSSNIDMQVGKIYLSLYGESFNQPRQNDYWLCYNDNEVCSKLGGEIYVPAESHWTGTNVYYITK